MNILTDLNQSCMVYLKDRITSLKAVIESQEILAMNSTEGKLVTVDYGVRRKGPWIMFSETFCHG